MTKIVNFHKERDTERLKKKAELDPSRVPEIAIAMPEKGKTDEGVKSKTDTRRASKHRGGNKSKKVFPGQ